MLMYLDIVGSCNLKCPTCPMGNSVSINKSKAMTSELFLNILKKAKNEGVSSIHLYNWTEPLIHPKIGDFITQIEAEGLSCGISSNLNLSKNLENAMRANPTFFRISLSGFSQETYSINHVNGDIVKVKENMIYLYDLKEKFRSKTQIQVYYHKYLDNIDDMEKMREFSEKLGFEFSSDFAGMMPLEKSLAYAEGDSSLTESDVKVIERLAIPPVPEVLEIAKCYIKKFYGNLCCPVKSMLVLDSEGHVSLCCSIFDKDRYNVGDYLNFSLQEIQARKDLLPNCVEMCDRCIRNGLMAYGACFYNGVFLEYAIENSLIFHARRLGYPMEKTGNALKRWKNFDEKTYLEANPDVQAAVTNGLFGNGFQHYALYGQHENRRGVPV